MRNLVKILFCFFLFLVSSELKPQQLTISGQVRGGEGKKVILSKVYGGQDFAVDSVVLRNRGDVAFSVKGPYTGVYRISFPDKSFFDLIVNNENIVFSCEASDPESTVNVEKSTENEVYYSFLHSVKTFQDSIELLTKEGQLLYEKDPELNKEKLQELAAQIRKKSSLKAELALSVSDTHPGLFASKIIRASVIPDFATYLQNEKNPVFKTEYDFLKYHYLDNVDFTDSSMLNTYVIYERCGEYIRNFASLPSVKAYKQLVDIMMGKVSSNPAVKEYILDLLLNTFDNPSWEDVYVYVADNYYLSGTCGSETDSAGVSERSMLIKKLKPGNIAPDFVIKSDKGTLIQLSATKSKFTLVFFWASWCEFCEDAMPELKKIFNNYNAKGLAIIAVSADTLRKSWEDASYSNAFAWINTCDFKGFKSPVLKAYNIIRTPCFFILDENKIILGSFYNVSALRKKLETLKWD